MREIVENCTLRRTGSLKASGNDFSTSRELVVYVEISLLDHTCDAQTLRLPRSSRPQNMSNQNGQ